MKIEVTKKPKLNLRFSTVLSRKLASYKAPILNSDSRFTSQLSSDLVSRPNKTSVAIGYSTFRRTRKIIRHLVQPRIKLQHKAILHDYIKTVAGADFFDNSRNFALSNNREVFGVRWMAMYRLREAKLHRQLSASLGYDLSVDFNFFLNQLRYRKLFEHRFYAKLLDKLRFRDAAVFAGTEPYLADSDRKKDVKEYCLFSGLTHLHAAGRRTEFFKDLTSIKQLVRQGKEAIQSILLELAYVQLSLERKSREKDSVGSHYKRMEVLRKVLHHFKKVGRAESPLAVLIDRAVDIRVPKLSHLLSSTAPSLPVLFSILNMAGQKPARARKPVLKLLSPAKLLPLDVYPSLPMQKEQSLAGSLALRESSRAGTADTHKASLEGLAFGGEASFHKLPQKQPVLNEAIEYRGVSRTRAGGRSRRFRVLMVIGRKMGWVGVGLGKHKYIPEAMQKAKREAARNICLLRRTTVGSIPHTVQGKFKKAKVLLKPLPVGSGMMTGSCLKSVLVLAGYSNVWGLQMGSPNKICNVRAALDALGQLRSDAEIIAARHSRRENIDPQAGLVAALKMYGKS